MTRSDGQAQNSKISHRAPLDAGLYIVSTPIGNMRDITLRALDVLGAVDYILAEDTRHTARLLANYDINAKLVSYNDHNAPTRRPRILEDLEAGGKIALVSDAGTPLISDPGWKLVREAQESVAEVYPVPGACAVMAGLVKSALPTDKFYFGGFLPPKDMARTGYLKTLIGVSGSLVFFESAKRITQSLESVKSVFGAACQVSVCRELTKTFEENISGPIDHVLETINAPPRGEIVLIVYPSPEKTDTFGIEETMRILLSELSVKTAADMAQRLGVTSKSTAYKTGLKIQNE